MKRPLVFLGVYLVVQPGFILGMFGLLDKKVSHVSTSTTNLPAIVTYQNDQVEITKANQRQKEPLTKQTEDRPLNMLENYLAKLEEEPDLVEGPSSTTQLGQKMKHLSKTFLFTG